MVNITVQLTAHEPPGLCYVGGIGWLLDTQVQLVGPTVFCLEGPTGSTPHGTQHNMGWQTYTVTADSCLGHQNVSFKAGPSPPHAGGSAFVKTKGGLAFLITGRGTAAIDSLSIDPVSTWLQNLPTSWQMAVLSVLGILFTMLFGCWCL